MNYNQSPQDVKAIKEAVLGILEQRQKDLSPDYNRFERKALSDAAGYIEALVPPEYFAALQFKASETGLKEPWIPVKEGYPLPDYDTPVLWYLEDGNMFVEALDKDGNPWLLKRDKEESENDWGRHPTATHWRPLPNHPGEQLPSTGEAGPGGRLYDKADMLDAWNAMSRYDTFEDFIKTK